MIPEGQCGGSDDGNGSGSVTLIPTTKNYINSHLIEDLDGEPLATLGALERLLPIVEALVVLLQVADLVEYFVALVAAKLAVLLVLDGHVRLVTALRTVPLLLLQCP